MGDYSVRPESGSAPWWLSLTTQSERSVDPPYEVRRFRSYALGLADLFALHVREGLAANIDFWLILMISQHISPFGGVCRSPSN
jgi:hypothetical protein